MRRLLPVVPLVAQALNFALSLLLWLIVGRWLLGVLVHAVFDGRPNFFTDLFRRGTEPAFAVVRRVTPRFIGDAYIPFCTIALILLLRVALVPLLRADGGVAALP